MIFKNIFSQQKKDENPRKETINSQSDRQLSENDINFDMRIFTTNRSKLYQDKKKEKGPAIYIEELFQKNLKEPEIESIHYSEENEFETRKHKRSLNLRVKGTNVKKEKDINSILKASFNQFS